MTAFINWLIRLQTALSPVHESCRYGHARAKVEITRGGPNALIVWAHCPRCNTYPDRRWIWTPLDRRLECVEQHREVVPRRLVGGVVFRLLRLVHSGLRRLSIHNIRTTRNRGGGVAG